MADFITNCGFTPTVGGTADWIYASAVTGYQSPAAAQAVNGSTYVLRAQSADLTQWEYSVGAYNSSTGTFARTTVLYNSSGTGTKQGGAGTKISFSAAPALVAVVAIAEELVQAQAVIPGGSLTLTPGVPDPSSDVSGATTVYYTPNTSNVISLYDGAIWVPIKFPETSLSLSGLTASTNYDVWGRISSGALALDTTAWTNATTRATAIVKQDGISVKSGDATRRLLGTIRTTTVIGQTEDSIANSFVSNLYNASVRQLQALDPAANWAGSGATMLRQANGNTSNQLNVVLCTSRMVAAEAVAAQQNTTASGTLQIGIGIDSTSSDSSTSRMAALNQAANGVGWGKANWSGRLSEGYHKIVWLECQNFTNGGTMTILSNPGVTYQAGITGAVAR